jgi:hypothetical protein
LNTRSWLPDEWPKTIVLIERKQQDEKGNPVYVTQGTGFITEHESVNILITCKHVVFNIQQKNFYQDLFVSFNQKDGTLGRRSLEEFKKAQQIEWSFHENPDIDLAIIPFMIDTQRDDIKRMGKDLYEKIETLTEGEEIFFLGFPALNIKKTKNIKPIVRAGIISLINDDKTFFIEANVFPGNSGSPVFLKPSIMDFKSKQLGQIRPAKFIGIINSYLSYLDTAVSAQTGRPRVTFEENSGLANVFSTSHIDEIFASNEFIRQLNMVKSK